MRIRFIMHGFYGQLFVSRRQVVCIIGVHNCGIVGNELNNDQFKELRGKVFEFCRERERGHNGHQSRVVGNNVVCVC